MDGLSEMEMRIVTELMEDWENIPTIANTVTLRTGEDAERREIKEALEKLVQADLVRIALPSSAGGESQELSQVDSLAVVAELETHLQFDSSISHWAGGDDSLPEICLTDTGFEMAGSVLDARPERWWWPPGWR